MKSRTFLTVMTATLLAIGWIGLISPAASAANATCATGHDPGNVTGTLTVPAGVNCTVQGDTISGDVIVKPGGTLVLESASVGGKVSSSGAGSRTSPLNSAIKISVLICASGVSGPVSVSGSEKTVQIGDEEHCGGNNIGNDVTVSGNEHGVELFGGIIQGSVTANNNSGKTEDDSSSLEVRGNNIAGSLSCSGNANGAIGSGNNAASKSGQCATV